MLTGHIRNKAVSDGAISFYLDHYVRTRVSKVTFGMFCNETFDSSQEDHRERESRAYVAVSGIKRLPDFFAIILPKVRLCFAFSDAFPSFFSAVLRKYAELSSV